MRYEFKLPDLAEGMVEGEIVNWLVNPGDPVAEEQPVVEVMTDKATVVIPSPKQGKLLEVMYGVGDLADVGSVLFVLETEGSDTSAGEAASVAAEPAEEPMPLEVESTPSEAVTQVATPTPPPVSSVPRIPRGGGKALATPATRKLARELGVDISTVRGTGPAGRVTKVDVRAHQSGVEPAAVPATPPAAPAPVAPAPVVAQPKRQTPAKPIAKAPVRPPSADSGDGEERIKVRGLRRAIYEAMARSKSTAAHFTYVEEIDCTQLVEARNRLKPIAAAQGIKLNYLPFIAKATLLALRHFPKMNAVMDDDAGEIVIKRYFHLGFAAATDSGLTVPVLRDADKTTLLELADGVAQLAVKAREGKLSPTEAKGSTFTITSLGKLGGLFATPIINHPEVAIMGVHKMEDRAVVRDGKIVARPMLNLSLSFDHRVIDGHEGAEFAQRVKYYLEDPQLMLLEMI
jgi:pyruvate dehydrogenase E2 component (dihydrolipoamide acetyltransferase)